MWFILLLLLPLLTCSSSSAMCDDSPDLSNSFLQKSLPLDINRNTCPQQTPPPSPPSPSYRNALMLRLMEEGHNISVNRALLPFLYPGE